MTESKITPPRELVRQWIKKCDQPDDPRWQEYEQDIANHAAQWGYDHRGEVNEAKLQQARDQELEACCALMDDWGLDGNDLMECRRPKPPSLKEQALIALDDASLDAVHENILRRALEALPDND